MEGCKIEHIKPCSEETAQGVIEALRKLRNASELSEASNRLAENIFEDILKSIKSNDMEENKKKMTKAEAFEYLKGRKVYVNSHSAHIQATLFEAGYIWSSGCRNIDNEDMPFLFTTNHGEFFTICNMRDFAKADYEEISAEDILSIEIIDDEKKSKEEDELDEINLLGSQICEILRHMKGHHHVAITETDVILYDEGMSLFHSDPF